MKVHQCSDHGLRARQRPAAAIAWRHRRLLDAGVSPTLAASVAADRRFDLHAALQLVDQGCPPDLAIQILQPVPKEMGS